MRRPAIIHALDCRCRACRPPVQWHPVAIARAVAAAAPAELAAMAFGAIAGVAIIAVLLLIRFGPLVAVAAPSFVSTITN